MLIVVIGIVVLCSAGPAAARFDVGASINIAQWFTWPLYDRAPKTTIAWPPYKKMPPAPTADDLKALKEAGFQTIRLPVDPAPFFVFEGTRREAVYGILFDALERIVNAGLNVIVDLHPNSRHAAWGQHAMVASEESPAYRGLNEVIADMARRLSRFEQNRVALELMNEPRLKCKNEQGARWQTMLQQMIAKARQAAPNLTLVVGGACVSSIDGLLALVPSKLGDRNLIYTFHFYEPFAFTHQGAQFIPWPEKYLDEVPWPASVRPIDRSLALLDRRVEEARLDFLAKQKARLGAINNLEKYYSSGAGRLLIDKRFNLVAAWARRHGIPPDRILIGEFGVLRKADEKPGALCADRMRWLGDVRRSAAERGFAWSYFSYDGPFALVLSDRTHALDPDVLSALGLRRVQVACIDPD